MTSLADKVARVKELDAKRTQGEWEARGCYVSGDNFDIYDEGGHTEDDAAFIAHAPQMADLIAQLWDEIEALHAVVFEPCCATEQTIQQQRDVMRMARDAFRAIETTGLNNVCSGLDSKHVRDHNITMAQNALARLNAIIGDKK